jgi:hypothetical protein
MLDVMDVTTAAEIGTAVGTLFLGVATFASVRSANQASRMAERSLLFRFRPILSAARPDDPDQEVIFGDEQRFHVRSGTAVVEHVGDVIYLVIPLRNVGNGLAVLQRYCVIPEGRLTRDIGSAGRLADPSLREHAPLDEFRDQLRDLYIASGDIGYWQASFRDPKDELHGQLAEAVAEPHAIWVELLYGDHEGGQNLISRFNLVPNEDGEWFCTMALSWVLDGVDPRRPIA